MSTPNNPQRRDVIRRTLSHHAGAFPDSIAVAEATFIIWSDVADLLTPVIGTKGVDVLFRRSLHLTTSSFPWLAITGPQAQMDRDSMLEGARNRLAGRKIDDSTEAGCTFLTILTELLTTLIGESLTERLLETVWVSTSLTSEQENIS